MVSDNELTLVRICRDEDCPKCGFPETYTEADENLTRVFGLGCRKCGWYKRVEGAPDAD